MKEIKAIIQPFMLKHALHDIPGLPAVTVSEVRDSDASGGSIEQIVKSKLEIMVPDDRAGEVMRAIQTHARTGKSRDGRVFIIPIEETISIRTGQSEFIPSTTEEVAASQNEIPAQVG